MRWVAVRHGADHIHIVAMLARQDGRRWRLDFEKLRVREACLAAEERYGLESTAPGDRTAARRPSRAETEKAARRGLDEPPRVTLRRQVTTAAAGARGDQEFFARLEAAGVLVRKRFSARNPGQVTGYAVALPGDTGKDGGPVWFGGGKLAADLSWPKLRCRWTGPGTAPGDPFTAAERNAMWDHAARSASQAAAQIRALAGTDPAAAADAAWAASDTLHAAAAALGSRILRQAADAYDRAARAPYARIPAPTPAGNSLRRAARLIAAFAYLTKDPSLAPIVLLTRLASLAEAVAGLRQAQQRAAQAAGALRAAERLHAAAATPAGPGRSGPPPVLSPAALAGASFPAPPRPVPADSRRCRQAQARPARSRAVPPPRQITRARIDHTEGDRYDDGPVRAPPRPVRRGVQPLLPESGAVRLHGRRRARDRRAPQSDPRRPGSRPHRAAAPGAPGTGTRRPRRRQGTVGARLRRAVAGPGRPAPGRPCLGRRRPVRRHRPRGGLGAAQGREPPAFPASLRDGPL